MVVVVADVVTVVAAHGHFQFVWVTWPLLSLIDTYVLILYTILAHMAQWLSTLFTVNVIATATGWVFESAKIQMFFTPF